MVTYKIYCWNCERKQKHNVVAVSKKSGFKLRCLKCKNDKDFMRPAKIEKLIREPNKKKEVRG